MFCKPAYFDKQLIYAAIVVMTMLFSTLSSAQTRTLAIQISGEGTLTSSPGNIDCTRKNTQTGTCSATFNIGSAFILTAKPAKGYIFRGWVAASTEENCIDTEKGDGSVGKGPGPVCIVTIVPPKIPPAPQTQYITALFIKEDANQMTLEVVRKGKGRIISAPVGIDCGTACSATFHYPTKEIVLTAEAEPGQSFLGWSGYSCPKGTSSPTCEIVLEQDAVQVTATFSDKPGVSLNVTTIGKGRVTSVPAGIDCGTTCNATFSSPADTVTLVAEADPGENFMGWSSPCSETIAATCKIPMPKNPTDIQVTATFSDLGGPGGPGGPNPTEMKTLSVQKIGQGHISSTPAGILCGTTCSAKFAAGGTVTLVTIPATGYRLANWGGVCVNNSANRCIVAMNIDRTITATFVPETCESRQFSPSEERMIDMFVAYYGRAPYAAGLDYWVGRLNAVGGDVHAIINAFGNEPEYHRRSQNMQNAALVNRLYEYILGRKADAAGAKFYADQLALGKETMGTIAIRLLDGVSGSGKDRDLLENRKKVARHFAFKTEQIRGRTPLSDVQLAEIMDKVTENYVTANDACNMLSGSLR